MRSIMGLELKKVLISPGLAHDKLQAELWLYDKKIGHIYNDGWIDELYIEFKNNKCQVEYMERNKKYNKKRKLACESTEELLRELLFLSRSYLSKTDKHLPGCKQITFI